MVDRLLLLLGNKTIFFLPQLVFGRCQFGQRKMKILPTAFDIFFVQLHFASCSTWWFVLGFFCRNLFFFCSLSSFSKPLEAQLGAIWALFPFRVIVSWAELRFPLPSFMLSAQPLHLSLNFSQQPRIIFQGTYCRGYCSFKSIEVNFAQRRLQSHRRRWCVPEEMIESEQSVSGWMVLKVRGWGSVMMQAAKSTSEDILHAYMWSLAGS